MTDSQRSLNIFEDITNSLMECSDPEFIDKSEDESIIVFYTDLVSLTCVVDNKGFLNDMFISHPIQPEMVAKIEFNGDISIVTPQKEFLVNPTTNQDAYETVLDEFESIFSDSSV